MDLDEYDEVKLVKELIGRRIARDTGLCDYCGRKPNDGMCKFPERHKGNVESGALFLADVSRKNLMRSRRWHPGFPKDDLWSGADWSNAMAGEAGEACNVVKKLRRLEIGAKGILDGSKDQLIADLAEEIADVYLYLDLLATKYGINKEQAIVDKFNKVSKLQDFPERLG